MSVTRWYLESDSIPNVQVYPTWSGQIEHDRVNEGVYFRAKISKEMEFRGQDYTNIFEAPNCELIEIYMEEKCGETWTERFRGEFTTFDVKFDKDKCKCYVSPRAKDDYTCILDKYTQDKVVSGAGDIVTVDPFAGTYQAGAECCMDHVPPVPGGPTDPVCPVPSGWCFDKNYFQDAIDGSGNELWQSCFHRITALGTPTTPPAFGTGWTLLSGSTWWRCPGTEDLEFTPLDNGRWLNDIIEYLVTATGCSITVRSHFFGINATHAAPPSNEAYTFADTYCQHIQVHQKSDVKRPDATNPAESFVWKMSLKKLLDDFENMMNVFWDMDGNDFILEHFSYFEGVEWLDLSQRDIVKVFEKKEGGAPNREHFFFVDAEATFNTPFAAYPIIYGDCGTGTKEIKLNYFSNDIYYIRQTDNQTEIADSNYCLVSAEQVGSDWVVKENNESMGWEALHENLHKQRRYFASGKMNDVTTTFTLLRKSRKLETLTVEHCCDDPWNPEGFITTTLGEASVERVVKDYHKDRAIIEANI